MSLKWHTVQQYTDKLYLQLKFDNPLYISTSLEQDSLRVLFFNNTSLFRSEKTQMALANDFVVMSKIKP